MEKHSLLFWACLVGLFLSFTSCQSTHSQNVTNEESPQASTTQPTTNVLSTQEMKAKKAPVVTIETRFGKMDLILYNETPLHKENFLKLAKEGFYDSTTFHRVIKGFMIQGGDPLSKNPATRMQAGTGGPNYTIPAEIVPHLKHLKGALAAARKGDNINPKRESSGSQFYIVQDEMGCQHLNGQYSVFGQVVRGLEVIDSIAAQPQRAPSVPAQDIFMKMSVKELSLAEIQKEYNFVFPDLKPQE
jgi:cyclophilin family peptidyl-prolyl cis-trans isomerase